MKSLVGQVINFRYEILEKTSEGSTFTVYRTRDKVMNRLAAVKVLKGEYTSDADFYQRLVMQARLLVPLSHPALTKVHEAEVGQDCVYIAEEHVRGIDLSERIRRIAPFTVASAVDVAVPVAQALEYLHRNGLIHGDLRPDKVLMGPDGEVKVTGAALALAAVNKQDRHALGIMRSAHYAAPELFEGVRQDERTDVYALGVIIYEMLTGVRPFDGETPIAIAMKHARDPVPSPRVINVGIPRAVEGIIIKALAKDPSARYQTAREMLIDLRSVQESLRVGKPLSWSPQDPAGRPEEASLAEETQESIWKSILKAGALVGLVAVVVFALFMVLVKSTPPNVTIPAVIGMSLEQARAKLTESGLQMEQAGQDYNEKFDEGEIYFSDPQYGDQVKKGAVVQVYVSQGSRSVRTPGVIAMSEGKAREVMENAGFAVRNVTTEFSSSVPAGDVIRQTPKPGMRVDRDKMVADLTVSGGPDTSIVGPSTDTNEPTSDQLNSTTEPQPSPSAKERKFTIRFVVPPGSSREVEIKVKDDNGQWTALDELHEGGDKVSATISATGKNVEIVTYLDGKEVDKQVK